MDLSLSGMYRNPIDKRKHINSCAFKRLKLPFSSMLLKWMIHLRPRANVFLFYSKLTPIYDMVREYKKVFHYAWYKSDVGDTNSYK